LTLITNICSSYTASYNTVSHTVQSVLCQRYRMYDSVMVAQLTPEQQQIVLLPKTSLPALRPHHFPIQWVPEAISPVAWA